MFLFRSVSKMASVLSRRLGKRSLLGTRVSAPAALAEGVLVATQIPGLPTGDLGRVSAPRDDGSCALPVEESGPALRFPSPGCQQLHAGQQVREEVLGVLGWRDVLWWVVLGGNKTPWALLL